MGKKISFLLASVIVETEDHKLFEKMVCLFFF